MRYYIGCSNWKNQYWIRDFYPVDLESKYYLSYYSKIFNFVHVDLNNFLPVPNSSVFKKWNEDTPDEFRFTIKIPQYMINSYYKSKANDIGPFLETLALLEEKILSVIISPPKEVTLKNNGREWLENILDICTYHGFSSVLEFNHISWYQDLTFNLLKNYRSVFSWAYNRHSCHYPIVTSNFIFINLDDNRDTIEHNKKWINLLNRKEKEIFYNGSNGTYLDFIIIVVNTPKRAVSFRNELKSNISSSSFHADQSNNFASTPLWSGKIIMHIDINAFFPTCEEILNPNLKGKPHAVIMTPQPEGPITRGAVASCSYEARRYGIHASMALSKAKDLCPDLILNRVNKKYYESISQQLMRLLEEYADVVEQASIDEAYIDCTRKLMNLHTESNGVNYDKQLKNPLSVNNENEYFGLSNDTVEEYALKIKNSIRENCFGLLCSIGVAPNKSIAKIASGFKKPDGLTVIYSQNLKKFLFPLEVNRISGIGVKTTKILKEMGIVTIGQLSKCDVQILIAKFGKKNGLWMWSVANGNENDNVLPKNNNTSLSVEETLLTPTKDKKIILEHFLKFMIDDIYEKTQIKGVKFRTVGIKLMRLDFSIATREITFSSYQDKKESIASSIIKLVEKFNLDFESTTEPFNLKSTGIRKIGIKISNLAKINDDELKLQKKILDYI